MVDQDAEGRRLSGLLSADPVAGEGRLADGSVWTLRWNATSSNRDRAALAVATPGAGHALATLDLDRIEDERALTAAWMSTPGSSGPALLGVAAGAAVDRVEVGRSQPGDGPSERAPARRLHRDPVTGQAVFVAQALSRADDLTVIGVDAAGTAVTRTTVVGTGREGPPTPTALPEVTAGWGTVFAVAGALAAMAVMTLALLPSSVTTRIVGAALGLVALGLVGVRRALARRQAAVPSVERLPHHYVCLTTAVFAGYVGMEWAFEPTGPIVTIATGAVLAAIVTADHRRVVSRYRRRLAVDRDTAVERSDLNRGRRSGT